MEFDLLRLIFSFLGGYFLSSSGSLSQLTTNNQLASPSTLGMDGIAVLTVLIANFLMVMGNDYLSLEYLSLSIFIMLIFIGYIYLRLRTKQPTVNWQTQPMKKIILMGLTFNLFVGAIFSVVQFLFMALNLDFPSGLWFGSFKFVNAHWLIGFLPFFVFSFILQMNFSDKLEKLNLGRDFAAGLGVDVPRIQKQSLLLALVMTSITISFFGVFSFLGLIFPHILRSFKFFEKSIRRELIIGPIFSGFALCFIDWLCFNFTYQGAELPVGMVSGVLGSFFLIFLISRSKI